MDKNKSNIYLSLFLVFLKIGAFTFGGGYAMIPLIQKEIAEKRKWITDDDILEIIAIAESTPGPIAINAATFVGYRTGGFWGAFFSTIGVVLPSFAIISIISYILGVFKNTRGVIYAFNGIRAGVLALLLKAMYSMYQQSQKGIIPYLVMTLSFVLAAVFGINVIAVIILCAAMGLASSLYINRRIKK